MFVEIHLKEIAKSLGTHYDRSMKDEYTALCHCGEEIDQTQSKCVCGAIVIWHGSKVWRNLYGSPDRFKRYHTTWEPSDGVGKGLLKRAGETGFANKHELDRWKRITLSLSNRELADCLTYCASKSKGRGLIAHMLNLCEKRIREAQPQEGWSDDVFTG